MKYIKPSIIEIFTTLLLQGKPIEVEKDYWWDEGGHRDENGKEFKPTPKPFFPYFERYLTEKKLKNCINISDYEDKNIIAVEDTPKEKKKFRRFLERYIKNYREGKLKPDGFVNYFPYMKNLDYMREVLYNLSDGFKQKNIVLYSYRLLRENKFKKDSDSLANEKLRLSEFLLDLFFLPKRKELIVIKPHMEKGGMRVLGNMVLVADIKLLEHPDTIYNTLARQLFKGQSRRLTGKDLRPHLKFSYNPRKENYSKNAYISLDENKIRLTKKQYHMVYLIANKEKNYDSKGKTMKWNINKKAKKILKDKDFELIIHDGFNYSLNEKMVDYNKNSQFIN